jgi:type II pantothenate kinase
VRQTITGRPWLIDDFDLLSARWLGEPHRKAIVFVDNAGADVTLGMIPLVRQMLRRGTQVIATANTHPALNDITHDELGSHLDAVAAVDPVTAAALGSGRLRRVASGNDAPLIDLRRVSRELADEADDADLLIIEGMGRAIETNLHAAFTCDCLKLAMIKEAQLARMLGGVLYDVVCKFEPAGA